MNNTIWTIIDNYFENKNNNLSLTQLDSYNAFLKLQISKTIRQFNPIIPEQGIQKNVRIEIIIGGSYDQDIGKIDEGITLSEKPDIKNDGLGIYIESSKKRNIDGIKELYPNECRLKNLTYTCELKCDVFIVVNIKSSYQVFKQERVSIGRIPVMLHSKLCNLYNKPENVLKQIGECQYDQGGYFIIDGKEKVIIAQERQVENQIYTTKKKDEHIEYESEIRSVKEGSFEPARVTKLHFFKNNTIKVSIPGFKNPIPLFVLFRFLGIISDKDITNLIINDFDNEMELKILDILYYSILDSKYINNEKLAVDLISKESSYFESKFFIFKNFIPHVGYDDKVAKAHFLAYMTRELILTKLNYKKTTNKDSFIHKRIDISGFLVGTIFRDLYFRIVNKIKEDLNKKLAKISIELSDIQSFILTLLTDILPLQFRNSIIPRKIIDEGFLYAFKNCWGLKDMKGGKCKQGIVQDLNRLNYVGYISHINRVNMPLSDSAKIREPHSLHASSFGSICPYETPDGGNIGLRKNLSILTKVSFDISSNSLFQVLQDLRVISIYELTKKNSNHCVIFINERIYGYYDKPVYLDYKLRLLRRNAIINIYTSITWNKMDNIIKINTDSGRLLRPVFVVNNEINTEFNLENGIRYKGYKNTLKINEDETIIERIKSNDLNWNKLIQGNLVDEENIDYNDKYLYSKYLPTINQIRSAENIEDYEKLLLEQDLLLEQSQCIIEYIDTAEMNESFIAMTPDDLPKNELFKYTHCEINPCLMLGPTASTLPLIERNQAPRNQYSCAQSKQAVGIYTTNYNLRMDTKGQIIYYPQKPIVQSRMAHHLYNNVLPQGINAIVAIASYSGYNQEDSILINKSALDRGLFRTITFKTYNDKEEILNDNKREFIQAPNFEKTQKLKNGNYSKLSSNGIIQEEIKVDENDIIVNKVVVDQKNTSVYYDNSQILKKNDIGIVDKVFYDTKNDEQKYVKIRIRKEKIPEIGDKFCSRFGQKGTIGMAIDTINMPFTKDGICPDIIVNPHAIPSRMTIGQLLETLLGKVSINSGINTNHVPFSETNIDEIGSILEEKYNYEKHCNEVLYNGINGKQLKVNIFIGPTFYQRLTHQVAEKFYSRNEGPKSTLNRQPVGGRSLGGGLRIGEMERDAILGHGVSGFLKESMIERSDKFKYFISDKSGLISVANKYKNIYNDFNNDETVIIENQKISLLTDTDFKNIQTPYAFKLMMQEFESMSIAFRLITEDSQKKFTESSEEFREDNFTIIEKEISYEASKIKHVIGKNGRKKKELEMLYSCSIEINNATNIIKIKGYEENVKLLEIKLLEIQDKEYTSIREGTAKLPEATTKLQSSIEYDFLHGDTTISIYHKAGIIIPIFAEIGSPEKWNPILKILLNKLTEHLSEIFKVFIIFSDDSHEYNLGALVNSGVKLAFLNECDYVILNPLSHIPSPALIEVYKQYPKTPINLSKDKQASVISINMNDFFTCNGYPNHILDPIQSHNHFLNRMINHNIAPSLFSAIGSELENKFIDIFKAPQDILGNKLNIQSLDYQLIQDYKKKYSDYINLINEDSINEDFRLTQSLSGMSNSMWFYAEPNVSETKYVNIFLNKFNNFTLPFYNKLIQEYSERNTKYNEEEKIPELIRFIQEYFSIESENIQVTDSSVIIKVDQLIELISEQKPEIKADEKQVEDELEPIKNKIIELETNLDQQNEEMENANDEYDFENYFTQKDILEIELGENFYKLLQEYNRYHFFEKCSYVIDKLKYLALPADKKNEVKKIEKKVTEIIKINKYQNMLNEEIDKFNLISEFIETRYKYFKKYYQGCLDNEYLSVNYNHSTQEVIFSLQSTELSVIQPLLTTDLHTNNYITFKNVVISNINFEKIRDYNDEYMTMKTELDDKYKEFIDTLGTPRRPIVFTTDEAFFSFIKQQVTKIDYQNILFYELIGKYAILYDINEDTLFYIDLQTNQISYRNENEEYGDDNELNNYNIFYNLVKFKLSQSKPLLTARQSLKPNQQHNPFETDELGYDYSTETFETDSPRYAPIWADAITIDPKISYEDAVKLLVEQHPELTELKDKYDSLPKTDETYEMIYEILIQYISNIDSPHLDEDLSLSEDEAEELILSDEALSGGSDINTIETKKDDLRTIETQKTLETQKTIETQ